MSYSGDYDTVLNMSYLNAFLSQSKIASVLPDLFKGLMTNYTDESYLVPSASMNKHGIPVPHRADHLLDWVLLDPFYKLGRSSKSS